MIKTAHTKSLYYYAGCAIPSDKAQSVHVMKMCEAFADCGYDVTLFAKAGSEGKDVFEDYGVKSNFKTILPRVNGAFRILNNVLRTIIKKKPDVIYGRDMLTLWLLSLLLSVPIIIEVHQLPREKWKQALLKRFSRIVVISDALGCDIKSLINNNKVRVTVAHDGASTIALPNEQSLPSDRCHIGYAGSFHRGKGIETIIALANTMPDVWFHVCGGNSGQVSDARSQCHYDNITFYGHVPHKNVADILLKCHVLIAPYQSRITIDTGENIARWTSPLKLFEYMALHKPIICSDLPVISEVIDHEHHAILVAPYDLDAWRTTIMRIYKNRKLADDLAQSAYNHLCEWYTWEKRAMRIIATF